MSRPSGRLPVARLRSLRSALREWSPPLEVIAERILGLESRIDLVARDPAGQCVVVGVAEPGQDLLALANLLAQRAWLEPRLGDWLQLAPDLGLDPSLGARGMLVAARFEARTLAAARALPEGLVALAVYREPVLAPSDDLALEPVEPAGVEPLPPALASVFRSGLVDEDPARLQEDAPERAERS